MSSESYQYTLIELKDLSYDRFSKVVDADSMHQIISFGSGINYDSILHLLPRSGYFPVQPPLPPLRMNQLYHDCVKNLAKGYNLVLLNDAFTNPLNCAFEQDEQGVWRLRKGIDIFNHHTNYYKCLFMQADSQVVVPPIATPSQSNQLARRHSNRIFDRSDTLHAEALAIMATGGSFISLTAANAQTKKADKSKPPNHWIQLEILDEHKQGFSGLTLVVTEASGKRHYQMPASGPVLFDQLTEAGPVTLHVEDPDWIKIAKQRTACPPSKNQPSKVQTYVTQQTGYQGSTKQYLRITCTDLLKTFSGRTSLKAHHHPGALDTLALHANHSYVLEVKGFSYKTLRLGVFFDGTGNNLFNSAEGIQALEQWLPQCETDAEREQVQKLLHSCQRGELPIEGSYANDISNIVKAHSLYLKQQDNKIVAGAYIEGIGTKSGGDDNLVGQALSLGDTSYTAKVALACQTRLREPISRAIQIYPETFDAFSKIEIDVFGFSRGAAAARYFINCIDRQRINPLAEQFKKDPNIAFCDDFEWGSRRCLRFTFAGLFDTVESAVFSSDEFIGVRSDQVEHLVQLCAADEQRKHFPLTSVANNQRLPDNFAEIYLPGCHSDIGGGYYSRHSLNAKPEPSLTECKCIKSFTATLLHNTTDYTQLPEYQQAKAYALQKIQDGWALELDEKMQSGALPKLGAISLCVTAGLSSSPYVLKVKIDVYINRIVEGEYSRIPLRLMVEAAQKHGVPFKDWDDSDKTLMLETSNQHLTSNLLSIQNTLLNQAILYGEIQDRSHALDQEHYKRLRYEYLHHSADETFVNAALYQQQQTAPRAVLNNPIAANQPQPETRQQAPLYP